MHGICHHRQESRSYPTVGNPVIERQRQLSYLSSQNLSVDDPGPIDNSANTKNRDFRSIDDGGCAIGAKDAVIIQSKGATGQLGRCALARASFGNHLVDFGGELSGREPFSMLDRWD